MWNSVVDDEVFVSAGDVFIADCENHRIQVFNRAGTFVRKFGGKSSNDGPCGIQLLMMKCLLVLVMYLLLIARIIESKYLIVPEHLSENLEVRVQMMDHVEFSC